MNHHADKALYFNEGDETRAADSTTGAFVEEINACPNCGASASRFPSRNSEEPPKSQT
jgi:hypothetical protein